MSNFLKLGFMQGRLSPLIDGKIQAFPIEGWREEFELAKQVPISLMEWTLDQCELESNPIMKIDGRREILALSHLNNIRVPSLTGDCFMQAPFWKATGKEELRLKKQFIDVIEASSLIGVELIVVPLVDNGSIETREHLLNLKSFLNSMAPMLLDKRMRIAFESDFSPKPLLDFISNFDEVSFGINYDMGNSASLGFDPTEELMCYGKRVINVHIKDRVYGGSTVPLSSGDVDFQSVFLGLSTQNYFGNFILQTARDAEGRHLEAIRNYCQFIYPYLDANWS